jgi:perosamine synthetase
MSTPFEPDAPAEKGRIPLCVPEIGGNEWNYVKKCLDDNMVSSVGPFVTHFEEKMAAYTGVQHAVATVNGTAAIHTALLIVGVRQDDEVLVSSLTFIAPVNAIRYVNAWPVMIDAEQEHWQMDVGRVEDFIRNNCLWNGDELRNRETGRRIKAVIPVHILGHPVDMDPLMEIARNYNLAVIEDATESLGARYQSRPVGSIGDIACFSFNGNKIITTGGGGMIVTNRKDWADRAKYLTTQAKNDPLEYVHNEIGYNYRLTNIQAAMGCAQLERLDAFVEKKRQITHRYTAAFSRTPGLKPMNVAKWAESTCWLFSMEVKEEYFGMNSRELLHRLLDAGIDARPLWQPAHLSPAHQGAVLPGCPVAEKLNRAVISLPSSVGLTEFQQESVIHAVLDLAKTA